MPAPIVTLPSTLTVAAAGVPSLSTNSAPVTASLLETTSAWSALAPTLTCCAAAPLTVRLDDAFFVYVPPNVTLPAAVNASSEASSVAPESTASVPVIVQLPAPEIATDVPVPVTVTLWKFALPLVCETVPSKKKFEFVAVSVPVRVRLPASRTVSLEIVKLPVPVTSRLPLMSNVVPAASDAVPVTSTLRNALAPGATTEAPPSKTTFAPVPAT